MLPGTAHSFELTSFQVSLQKYCKLTSPDKARRLPEFTDHFGAGRDDGGRRWGKAADGGGEKHDRNFNDQN